MNSFLAFVRDWGLGLQNLVGALRRRPTWAYSGKGRRLSGMIGSWRLRGTATRYFGVLCYCDRTGAVSEAESAYDVEMLLCI